MYPVSGCIELLQLPRNLASALAKALDVEARNPPDPHRGEVTVKETGNGIVICFRAKDLSSARALLNSYLTLLATVVDAVAASES